MWLGNRAGESLMRPTLGMRSTTWMKTRPTEKMTLSSLDSLLGVLPSGDQAQMRV